jgi:rod shape-determining protein MreB
VAVISLGGIVTSKTVRVAGDTFCDDIIRYIKLNHNLIIGKPTAETIKTSIASALYDGNEEVIEVKGRDSISGLPKNVEFSSSEACEAINTSVLKIIDAIKITLEETPPELSSDILERGIVISGGSSLLKGIAKLIEKETGMQIFLPETSKEAVALGMGRVMEKGNSFKKDLMIKHK